MENDCLISTTFKGFEVNELLNKYCFKIFELGQKHQKIDKLDVIKITAGDVGSIWIALKACKSFNYNKKYITRLGDKFIIRKLYKKYIKLVPSGQGVMFLHINNIPCIVLEKGELK